MEKFLIAIFFLVFLIVLYKNIKRRQSSKVNDAFLNKGQKYYKYLIEKKEKLEKEISESPTVFLILIPEPNEGRGFEYWSAIEHSSKKDIMDILKGVPWGAMSTDLDEFHVQENKKILVEKKGIPILTFDQLKNVIANRESWPKYNNLQVNRRF